MKKDTTAKNNTVFSISIKEESETIIREFPRAEVNAIAELLGFDTEQDGHFQWFLKQALLALLPKGWKRESNPDGKVVYHNSNSLATTQTHPLLYRFRSAYVKLLK